MSYIMWNDLKCNKTADESDITSHHSKTVIMVIFALFNLFWGH